MGSAKELLLTQSKPTVDRRSLERLSEAIQATLFEDAQPEVSHNPLWAWLGGRERYARGSGGGGTGLEEGGKRGGSK